MLARMAKRSWAEPVHHLATVGAESCRMEDTTQGGPLQPAPQQDGEKVLRPAPRRGEQRTPEWGPAGRDGKPFGVHVLC